MDSIDLTLPNYTRAYKIRTGDIIEYTLEVIAEYKEKVVEAVQKKMEMAGF